MRTLGSDDKPGGFGGGQQNPGRMIPHQEQQLKNDGEIKLAAQARTPGDRQPQ
jgi:hypothetical protein